MNSFLYQTPALLITVILFTLMVLFNRAGFFVRKNEVKRYPEIVAEGLGPVEGSLLGLLALLLSFTFSLSASKSDSRREVIVEEANDISTAISRCDLYPDSIRKELQLLFGDYVDARIAYYDAGVDEAKLNNSLQKTNEYYSKIWKRVMILSQDKENVLRSQQMVPALNAMSDIVTTRDSGRNAHVPESILWMLFMLTLAGSFVMGYGSNNKRYNWVIVGSFALMTVMTIYLILDLDRPRRGIINMDATQQKIVELKAMLK
jgi:prepilin signal peptidase PulO-like enzyme (type II secretory pathway)